LAKFFLEQELLKRVIDPGAGKGLSWNDCLLLTLRRNG